MPAAGASPAIANGLLLLSALTLASSLFNTCLLSSGEGLDLLVQSDSLLPAQMAWDMHQSPAWARHFQWPRVPSLFPDMVWFHAAAWLGLSWRHAWLAYTPLILSMLAGAMGGLIAALRGESGVQAWLRGSTLAALAIALGMAAITLLAARTGLAPWKDALMVLAPASHGDGFILSLLATVAAMQAMRGNRKAWRAMLAFCVVGTFGDLLFVAAFLAPLAVASRLSAWQAGGRKAALTGQWGLLRDCTAACLAGWLGQSALFRQSVNEVELHRPADALRGMAGGMATAPWTGLCLLSAGVLIAAAGRRAWACLRGKEAKDGLSKTLLAHGALATAFSLAIMISAYSDSASWRYALPALWWPIAAGLAAWPATHIAVPFRLGAATIMGLGTVAIVAAGPPALLGWRSPVARCIADARTPRGEPLHSGLATYWLARQTEAADDWRRQIAPITETGQRRIWGNDISLFTRDAHLAGQPARFDFIVIDPSVAQEAMIRTYGAPVRRTACGGAQLWIYDHWLGPPAR